MPSAGRYQQRGQAMCPEALDRVLEYAGKKASPGMRVSQLGRSNDHANCQSGGGFHYALLLNE
jgi:hypothetical protein